jgi:hypothetical protein
MMMVKKMMKKMMMKKMKRVNPERRMISTST